MPASFDHVPRPAGLHTYHQKPYDRIDPKTTGFDGKGKTVLITAGATGIGYAIATSFAKTGINRVVILSRSPGPQEKAKTALKSSYPEMDVVLYQVSIMDHARTNAILKEVGIIDVLILSATALEPTFNGRNVDLNVDDLQTIFDTNVVAAFNLVQAYLRLPEPSGGRKTIINVSSLAAFAYIPGQVGYGPSKAAITQVFYHLSQELDPSQVALLSFHPGAVYTEKAASLDLKDLFNWDDVELPGRFAVWLATPEASFLHGRMVWANWDVDELLTLKDKVEKDPTFLTIGLLK